MILRVTKGLVITAVVMGVSGCAAADVQKFNHQLAEMNTAMANNAATAGVTLARQPNGTKKQIELVEPTDKQTSAAMEHALPTIKKVLAIYPCLQHGSAMSALNPYAVPGTDMSPYYYAASVPIMRTQYHDKNVCMSVTRLDSWTMPAMNILKFRSIFIADDSGETNNIFLLMRRMEDGQWKFDSISTY